MSDSINLDVLSTRSGFNSAVRHIKKTLEIAAGTDNLGSIIQNIDDEEMTGSRISLLKDAAC